MSTRRFCTATPFELLQPPRAFGRHAGQRFAFNRSASAPPPGRLLHEWADATPWRSWSESDKKSAGLADVGPMADVGPIVAQWMRLAPPGAQQLFLSRDAFRSALEQIAKGVSDDPFSNRSSCVCWCGEVSPEDGHAVIRLEPVGDQPTKQGVYVNRVVSVCFGAAGTWDELVDRQAPPFATSCSNPRCLRFCHIRHD
eukprot:TRINITY_DN13860_c0_g1_i1.p1 TRINITY_DN13860_c0_g1~~TRINITY_DN13860_c0_g1_i1.p1  ORF type:complete len:223 (+),score=23.04 TRINITY_DN13860_c0_g1_i1:76-669(+)